MSESRPEAYEGTMMPVDPFGDVPVFADLTADEQTALLFRRVANAPPMPDAEPPRRVGGLNLNPFAPRPYAVKEAVVGYVSPASTGDDLAIRHASDISGDPRLIGVPLTVSLDRFYVQEYPGLGTHQVLCTFTVGCLATPGGQTSGAIKQDVTFGYAFPVEDRQAAALSGMPIFRDLRIGDGLYMWIGCINTNSTGDDALLQALSGDPFGKGLQFLAVTNPVTSMLSSLVAGVAKHFLNASRDALIFKPLLGLQVSGETSSGKLREGSYIIAQARAEQLKWPNYRWRKSEGRVVDAASDNELPFNYFVLSVRRQPDGS